MREPLCIYGEEKMLDEKLYVTLGGVRQKIHIKSEDQEKTVLLFLHGGPGVCNRHLILINHVDLLDTFTLVGWDQRGSGGSWRGVSRSSLTLDRMVEDARELVEYLCRRFNKDKIFIIGGSWGSELGTYLSYRHPEHIAAFVGFGQVVNGALNETLSWEFSLREAEKAGDEKSIRILKKIGPPVMGMYKGGYSGMMKERQIMNKFGGYSKKNQSKSYTSGLVDSMLHSGEYSNYDLWGLFVGHRKVLNALWPEVGKTDFKKECTRFSIPFYIFDGRLDQNTPADLVEDWYNLIETPDKDLIWFEESGHNPMTDEGEKFKKLLREKLLAVKAKEECRI